MREFSLLAHCTQEECGWVIDFCRAGQLICEIEGSPIKLSGTGLMLADTYLSQMNIQITFRKILEQYIRVVRPGWANRMPVGRQETFAALSKDERFCFHEAGLDSNPPNDAVVDWWDRVASEFRSQKEKELLAIGRIGERLSIRYEQKRVGRTPMWVSIDTNFAGYDLLSVEDQCTQRRIEVKSSEKPFSIADFIISKNEWDVASCAIDTYYFHLWLLNPHPKVAVVRAKEMASHVAQNQGAGLWISVMVPFSVFSGRFVDFDCEALSEFQRNPL